jgi:hypothetical protein
VIYCVYGLRVSVNAEIPGLSHCKVNSLDFDVLVSLGAFPKEIKRLILEPSGTYYTAPTNSDNIQPRLTVKHFETKAGEYFLFRYDYGVRFLIDRNATSVWGEWDRSLTISDASLFLLGPILGYALRLRGITCLHASCVSVDGEGLALTGPSGAGKSTTAAAFAAAGYPVISDDVLPLMREGNGILGIPGYPRLRLWPDAVTHLDGHPEARPRLIPNWDKRYLDILDNGYLFYRSPTPLRAIYCLSPRINASSTKLITFLEPRAAIPVLAANTYRNELLDREMRTQQFRDLAAIVKLISIRKVTPKQDISSLPDMCQAILSDFEGIESD